jgi:hypothetical protein
MPRPVDRTESIDLHAPWWSDERDSTGRYVERWVVRKEMSEKNQQSISATLRPVLKMTGNTGRNGNSGASEMLLNELPFSRLYTLLEMTIDITDETGQQMHISKDMISSFPVRDTTWVADELDKLYAAPIIEPDEIDERNADMLAQQAEYEGKPVPADANPQAQAVHSFRPHRKVSLQR